MKRWGLTDEVFLKKADRLTYFIFFPALLFWKIGGASSAVSDGAGLYKAVFCAVFVVYVLSTLFIKLYRVPDYKAGTFSQSCYRFNSYIGVAVVMSSLSEAGIKQFGILIGMIIPVINVLCVSTLIYFSGEQARPSKRLWQTVRALVSNPLILACISGILYAHIWEGFPLFVDNTLKLSSYISLPLAMLSVGGALTFETVRDHFKLSLMAAMFKLVVLPLTGYFFLQVFGVSGPGVKIGLLYFALPASPALYILSSQLNSDTKLASASIALSTVLSFFSLSIALSI